MAMLVLLPMAAMSAVEPVPNLDLGAMQRMIMTHDKVLLLMFMKGCSKLEQIVPTLDAVAREVPELAKLTYFPLKSLCVALVPHLVLEHDVVTQARAPANALYFVDFGELHAELPASANVQARPLYVTITANRQVEGAVTPLCDGSWPGPPTSTRALPASDLADSRPSETESDAALAASLAAKWRDDSQVRSELEGPAPQPHAPLCAASAVTAPSLGGTLPSHSDGSGASTAGGAICGAGAIGVCGGAARGRRSRVRGAPDRPLPCNPPRGSPFACGYARAQRRRRRAR